MRVALVHYWLVGMRGGEKVIEEMCRIWPDADIFTHVYDPARYFRYNQESQNIDHLHPAATLF